MAKRLNGQYTGKARVKKTSKIFYKKYTHKVSIFTSLGYAFDRFHPPAVSRNINYYEKLLSNIKLDSKSSTIVNGKRIYRDDILPGRKLVQLLIPYKDEIKVSASYDGVLIYMHNQTLYDTLSQADWLDLKELTSPISSDAKDWLVENSDCCLVSASSVLAKYKYKVYYHELRSDYSKIEKWAQNMGDRIRFPGLDKIGSWTSGYFYVRNTGILTQAVIVMGDLIRKIEPIGIQQELAAPEVNHWRPAREDG